MPGTCNVFKILTSNDLALWYLNRSCYPLGVISLHNTLKVPILLKILILIKAKPKKEPQTQQKGKTRLMFP